MTGRLISPITHTVLVAGSSSVTYGDESPERFTATVTSSLTPAPTGTVVVSAGSVTLCTIALSGGTGSCSPAATSLAAGSYMVLGNYSGDDTHDGSTGGTSITVGTATTATSLASLASTSYRAEGVPARGKPPKAIWRARAVAWMLAGLL
jgi:hypothetical protein